MLLPGRGSENIQCAIAYASGGSVDHPLEGGVIVAVGNQTQVSHGILDLLTLEEAQAAIDAIGQPLVQQGLFQYP